MKLSKSARGCIFTEQIVIDLHTHSLFSDGVLIPSELIYRAKVRGYAAIAVTDHGDFSTFDIVIPRLRRIAPELSRHYGITVVPGIEVTYVPPALIAKAVAQCRKLGARIVVVHGETPAETVPAGTNRAAILARADILAHPGRITEEEVLLAKKRDVLLEITTRRGHNRTNRHVAQLARRAGAKLVLDTDSHEPGDLLTEEKIRKTLAASGLTRDEFLRMQENARDIVRKSLRKR